VTLVALTLAAQLADLSAFLLAVERVGLSGELNPLMVAVAGAGIGLLVAVKVAGALVLGALVWRLRHRRVSLLPAGAGIVGAATGLAALT
jgi:hypothetical protein